MPELNSTMFYKVKFTISAREPEADLLWKIVRHVKNWQVRKCAKRGVALTRSAKDWTRLKWGGQIFTPDNSVYFKSAYFAPEGGGEQSWACQAIEDLRPDVPGCAEREWTTEIGYEQEGDAAVLSCVVSYSDRAGFIGPYMDAPTPSIPKLVRNIINDKEMCVSCGPDVLTGKAMELKPGDWPELYGRIVDPARQLPYVFISPQTVDRETGKTAHLIQPAPLADKLFGNALVFYTSDPDFSREMRYMNDDYACYGGALRVYQPNATDPAKHRYLSAADIERYGEEAVDDFLVRAFAQNVHFYDSFFCIEECQKKKAEHDRRKRMEALQAEHQKQIELVEGEKSDTLALAIREEERRLKAEELQLNAELETERIQAELDDAKRANHNLKAQVDLLQTAAEENIGLRLSLDARFEVASLPQTAEDVVDYFGRIFADKIAFSEDCRRPLKGCTLPPAELWRVFFALANTMRDLYMTGEGDIFSAFRRATGIDAKRGEGTATRNDKKLMKQFETEWNGETIDIEAHITYPKLKQSIHFGFSGRGKKVVVGHCGGHLDNYSTRKVK